MDKRFRIEPERIVNASGIAMKIGVARSTVANYAKRYKDFPKPLETPGVIGISLYDWAEVEAWFEANFAERNPKGFGQSTKLEPIEEETP